MLRAVAPFEWSAYLHPDCSIINNKVICRGSIKLIPKKKKKRIYCFYNRTEIASNKSSFFTEDSSIKGTKITAIYN
jgi:hypothetical protein